jgi:hypothetical protein
MTYPTATNLPTKGSEGVPDPGVFHNKSVDPNLMLFCMMWSTEGDDVEVHIIPARSYTLYMSRIAWFVPAYQAGFEFNPVEKPTVAHTLLFH